jgi:hypothetical protein
MLIELVVRMIDRFCYVSFAALFVGVCAVRVHVHVHAYSIATVQAV